MIRVVLDTNVIVSALLQLAAPAPPAANCKLQTANPMWWVFTR
jgi:predicted nucleic acid-binding protein